MGELIKKLDINKTETKGNAREQGEKGHWKHRENNTTKRKVEMDKNTTEGEGENSSVYP
ncbi:hypothetical protein BDD12DRAFT_874650 [Trichophaea hybrida]|nr:hypothetical protein BDD12DRAFT_874650 [Trichophaea hybrida]